MAKGKLKFKNKGSKKEIRRKILKKEKIKLNGNNRQIKNEKKPIIECNNFISYKDGNLFNIFSKRKGLDSHNTIELLNKSSQSKNSEVNNENNHLKYPENLNDYKSEFELKYNSYINPVNRNLYISKSCKFDEKKKKFLLDKIIEKARKKEENKNYEDMEIILLIYLNLKFYYSSKEVINAYLYEQDKKMIDLFDFKIDIKKILEKNATSQIANTLHESINSFEFEFFKKYKYIFVDFKDIQPIYNLFDFNKYDKNEKTKKEILINHIEYTGRFFRDLTYDINLGYENKLFTKSNNINQIDFRFIRKFLTYINCKYKIEDKKFIDILDYYKNIYGPEAEKCTFISHEIPIKKSNEKESILKYIIVREYTFTVFNHFYNIDSDGLINRFKYNLLIIEDPNIRFKEILSIENVFENSNVIEDKSDEKLFISNLNNNTIKLQCNFN